MPHEVKPQEHGPHRASGAKREVDAVPPCWAAEPGVDGGARSSSQGRGRARCHFDPLRRLASSRNRCGRRWCRSHRRAPRDLRDHLRAAPCSAFGRTDEALDSSRTVRDTQGRGGLTQARSLHRALDARQRDLGKPRRCRNRQTRYLARRRAEHGGALGNYRGFRRLGFACLTRAARNRTNSATIINRRWST